MSSWPYMRRQIIAMRKTPPCPSSLHDTLPWLRHTLARRTQHNRHHKSSTSVLRTSPRRAPSAVELWRSGGGVARNVEGQDRRAKVGQASSTLEDPAGSPTSFFLSRDRPSIGRPRHRPSVQSQPDIREIVPDDHRGAVQASREARQARFSPGISFGSRWLCCAGEGFWLP